MHLLGYLAGLKAAVLFADVFELLAFESGIPRAVLLVLFVLLLELLPLARGFFLGTEQHLVILVELLLELLLDLVALPEVLVFDLVHTGFFLGHALLVSHDVAREGMLFLSALGVLQLALDLDLSHELSLHFCALLSNSVLALLHVVLLVSHVFQNNLVPLGFSHAHALVVGHGHQLLVNVGARVRLADRDVRAGLAQSAALLGAAAERIGGRLGGGLGVGASGAADDLDLVGDALVEFAQVLLAHGVVFANHFGD